MSNELKAIHAELDRCNTLNIYDVVDIVSRKTGIHRSDLIHIYQTEEE